MGNGQIPVILGQESYYDFFPHFWKFFHEKTKELQKIFRIFQRLFI